MGSALLAGAPAAALPSISEVFYDAVGSDDGWIFVEIYASAGQLLDGYVVKGVNGSNGQVGPAIDLVGAAGSDGLFVLADHMSDGSSFVTDAEQLANFDFQNGPDSFVSRDSVNVRGRRNAFIGEGFRDERDSVEAHSHPTISNP